MFDTITELVVPTGKIHQEDRIGKIAERFREEADLDFLVVVNEEDKIVGLVTRNGILASVSTSILAALWERRPIRQLMYQEFRSIDRNETPETALLALFKENGDMHEALLVTEKDQFIGGIEPIELMRVVADRAAESAAAISASEARVKDALKQVTESVHYASRIQRSQLPHFEEVSNSIADFAFRWHPRDVVSGDIYLFKKIDPYRIIGVIDCTGHGVPGSLMTMVASATLNQAIAEIDPDDGRPSPAAIMGRAGDIARQYLNQHVATTTTDDGFDAALCVIDENTHEVLFSGAKLDAIVISRDLEPQRIAGSRTSLAYPKKSSTDIDLHDEILQLNPDSVIVLTTDGIIDQVGEHLRRSFGYGRAIEALNIERGGTCEAMLESLEKRFHEHQGNEERRDDLTVIAFRPF